MKKNSIMKKILLKTRIVLTNISRVIMSFLFINLNFSLANKVFGVSIDSMQITCYGAEPSEIVSTNTFTLKNVLIILVPVAIIIGAIILIVKRKLVGSLLYLAIHAVYFGGDVTDKLNIMANNGQLTVAQSTDFIFSVIGIILPLAVLLDLLLDKNRKENPKDKKTDWFYKNEEFDRKLDDRADKNNYRTM